MGPPEAIQIHRDQRVVEIRWSADHVSVYPFRWLREQCECAACKNEWTGERLVSPEQVPEDLGVEGAELVGNYALRIRWSDGHDTGLYTWEHLASLCRCTRCERKQRQGPEMQ